MYRDRIGKVLQSRLAIHGNLDVRNLLKKAQTQFQDYQLSLYLYAYSAFLEVILLENYSEGYLNSIEEKISAYAYQYRTLYTDCDNRMENYLKSSIQAGIMSGLASAGKHMGNAISKLPLVRKSSLDENLIEAGHKMGLYGEKQTVDALSGLRKIRMDVTAPFAENIREINHLYNKPVCYLMDKENIYIRQVQDT